SPPPPYARTTSPTGTRSRCADTRPATGPGRDPAAGPGGDPAATRNLSHTRGERLWSVQLTPEADFRWCRSAGDISRALPGQALLSLSPNMPWAAPLTVSRASSSLSLASALPCWALPSASVSLSSVTLPKPSLAWPLSLPFAFSRCSSALIANLLESPHRSCALRRV